MQIISTSFVPSFPCRRLSFHKTLSTLCFEKKQVPLCCVGHNFKVESSLKGEEWNGCVQYYEEDTGRRCFLLLSLISLGSLMTLPATGKVKSRSPYDEKRLLEQNKKMQEANYAPEDFPNFIREGFQVKVVTSDNYVKCESGLIYRDIEVGKGDCPEDGQQGAPAKIRLGNKTLVPGFEEGIRDMRPGGKRRIIIPPELGPPVGPSTFFSAKQFEVFDVELLNVQNCQRRTIAFYSDVVCD
ncbi:FKBP-like peptidyl-prolyl cis-trans isomerase family protein isoform X2 [Tasmannia lanceolata]|uniref:FKBP-like peptidyl-prolyl cis-trans isomerase family protein isoform X2 n=1 Tax=Tasmannia lanceolata TaxID=3420 RepID=UPI0040639609